MLDGFVIEAALQWRGLGFSEKVPGAFINLNECHDPPGPAFDLHKVHGND